MHTSKYLYIHNKYLHICNIYYILMYNKLKISYYHIKAAKVYTGS